MSNQNQNLNGVKFQSPDFGASQNAPEVPEPQKTKIKTKSGIRLGILIAVVLLVLVGIGTAIVYFLIPKVWPETLTFQADMDKLFTYTADDKSLYDPQILYGKNSTFDYKKAGDALFTFPKGLHLDTRFYTNFTGDIEKFSPNHPLHLIPASVTNEQGCLLDEKDFKLGRPDGTIYSDQDVIGILAPDFDQYYKPLIGDNKAQFQYDKIDDFHRLAVYKSDGKSLVEGVTWQSSNPSVLAVYPDGSYFPFSNGNVEVRATLCGKELAKVKVLVDSMPADFNPVGEFDSRFLQGAAISRENLFTNTAPQTYIRKAVLKPQIASFYAEFPKIVDKIAPQDKQVNVQNYTYYKSSPVQGAITFFLSNDGGKNWVKGDKKIDNKITHGDLEAGTIPEISFNFATQGNNLKLAVVFQSDFQQNYYIIKDLDVKVEDPYASPGDNFGADFQKYAESVKMGDKVVLPIPGPILMGMDVTVTRAETQPKEVVKIMPPFKNICQTDPKLCDFIPIEQPQTPEPPTVEGLGIEPVVWHRGHSRVILKWKFTSGADNNLDPANIEFKYGETENNLLLGAKVYRDKNDEQYPYYVVLRGLKGGEYFDKNDAGYEAGRFKNFYQIKTGGKSSGAGSFQTMNRIQTIGYYYDLVLNRQYVSGANGDLNAWLNQENEFQGKKIKDLENGGPGFFYKPENGEPLTLLGVKFTMLNDKKYQEFDKNVGAAAAQNMTTTAQDLYRKIHDRIYDEDLGKFFDDGGVEYWVSRTDTKIVGKDVMDILGVKFYMSVSTEYQNELYSGIGVADAKPELAYQIVLKRGADSAGLVNLKNKYQFSKDMRKELAMSKEYEDRLTDIEKTRGRAAAIEELYETLYARATDVEGRNYWDTTAIGVLGLRNKFLASEEFVKVLKD